MTIEATSRCVSVRAFTDSVPLLQAPVIIEDEDDFKPSASKGGEGAKKSSQDGLKRKRGRARIKYMYESDSEEEAPPKKTKPSPKMGSGAARTDTKGQKRVATTPKRQEVKSVSAFFGSAPVKRSSDFKNSKSTADGGDSKKDGGRKGKEGKEGEEGKDTVICIPESPVDVTSHQFDEEVISEVGMSSITKQLSKLREREGCRSNSLPLHLVANIGRGPECKIHSVAVYLFVAITTCTGAT